MAKEVVKNYIGTHRQKAAITQEELAKGVGVSRQTIIAIERGNYTPSVFLALKLASFFGVPAEKLFYIKNEK